MNPISECNTMFSVIVPVYNVENYLCECINSILYQTYKSFEIILVDDGSTDNSGLICDQFAKQECKIKVIHQENSGLLMARRVGLQAAIGKYICFLDSDDFWNQNCLEQLKNVFDKTDCDVIAYRWNLVDMEGKILNLDLKPAFAESGLVDKSTFFKKMIETTELNSLCLKCCKKCVFDIDRDYSDFSGISNGEDLLQSLPVVYNASSFFYLNTILYNYRFNPVSITHVYRPSQYETLTQIRPLVYEYMCAMKMDNESNVRLFYDHYLKIIWQNLDLMYAGVTNKVERRTALSYIYSYEFVKKANDFLMNANIDKVRKFGLKLFYKQEQKRCLALLDIYFYVIHKLRKTIGKLRK